MRAWMDVFRTVIAVAMLATSTAMAQEEPLTVAERSGFEQTSTSAQVESFLGELDRKSDRTWLGSIGTSKEGKDLPLLVVADPRVTGAKSARSSDRLVVLLFGNIHAGEVAGKEALLALARELALGERSALLDDLIVCFLPNYNPDGNDAMSPDNRPGQVGPQAMG